MNKISILINALKRMNVNPKHIEELYALDKIAAFTAPNNPERTRELMYGKEKEDAPPIPEPQIIEEQTQEENPSGVTPQEIPVQTEQREQTPPSPSESNQDDESDDESFKISCKGVEISVRDIVNEDLSLKTDDCGNLECLIYNSFGYISDTNITLLISLFLYIYRSYRVDYSIEDINKIREGVSSSKYITNIFDQIYDQISGGAQLNRFYKDKEIVDSRTRKRYPAPDKYYIQPFAEFCEKGMPILADLIFGGKNKLSVTINNNDKPGEKILKGASQKVYDGSYLDEIKKCFVSEIKRGFSNEGIFEDQPDALKSNYDIKEVREITQSENTEDKKRDFINEAINLGSPVEEVKEFTDDASESAKTIVEQFKGITESGIRARAVTVDRDGKYKYNGAFKAGTLEPFLSKISTEVISTRLVYGKSTEDVFYTKDCLLAGLNGLARMNIIPVEFLELKLMEEGRKVETSSLNSRTMNSEVSSCLKEISSFINKYSDASKKTHPYSFYISRVMRMNKKIGGEEKARRAEALLEDLNQKHIDLNESLKSYADYSEKFSDNPIINFYGNIFVNKERVVTSEKNGLGNYMDNVVIPLRKILSPVIDKDSNFYEDDYIAKFVRSGGKNNIPKDIFYIDLTSPIDRAKIRKSEGKEYIEINNVKWFRDNGKYSKNGKYILTNYLSDLNNLVDKIGKLDCNFEGKCNFDTNSELFSTICAYVNSEGLFKKNQDGSVTLVEGGGEILEEILDKNVKDFYISTIYNKKYSIVSNIESQKVLFGILNKYASNREYPDFYEKLNKGVQEKIELALDEQIDEELKYQVKRKTLFGKEKMISVDIAKVDPDSAEIIREAIKDQTMPTYQGVPSYDEVLARNDISMKEYEKTIRNQGWSDGSRKNSGGSGKTPADYVADFIDRILEYLSK